MDKVAQLVGLYIFIFHKMYIYIVSFTEVTNLIEKCPVCGDSTVGNGSKFFVEEDTFERTCRECGWRITGKVENNKLVVTSDNRDELIGG